MIERVWRMLEKLDEEKIFDIVLVVATIVIMQFVARARCASRLVRFLLS
jgi:hypothetical protein